MPADGRAAARLAASAGTAARASAALAAAIEAATRPAVIVGLQVNRARRRRPRPVRAIRREAGRAGVRDAGREGHAAGAPPAGRGHVSRRASRKALLDDADLLVLVGFDPVEMFSPGLATTTRRSSMLDEVPYTEGPYRPAIEVVAGLDGQPAGADGGRDAALTAGTAKTSRRITSSARRRCTRRGSGLHARRR